MTFQHFLYEYKKGNRKSSINLDTDFFNKIPGRTLNDNQMIKYTKHYTINLPIKTIIQVPKKIQKKPTKLHTH